MRDLQPGFFEPGPRKFFCYRGCATSARGCCELARGSWWCRGECSLSARDSTVRGRDSTHLAPHGARRNRGSTSWRRDARLRYRGPRYASRGSESRAAGRESAISTRAHGFAGRESAISRRARGFAGRESAISRRVNGFAARVEEISMRLASTVVDGQSPAKNSPSTTFASCESAGMRSQPTRPNAVFTR